MITIPIDLLYPLLFGLCIALLFAIKGFIGKNISDDIHCKKCKYNLSHLNTQVSQSTQCPECGNDISLAKNTKRGYRQKQKKYFIASAACIILSITYLFTANTIQHNLNKIKPLSWLNQDLYSTDFFKSRNAISEIIRRTQENEISEDELMPYYKTVLAYANNPTGEFPRQAFSIMLYAVDSQRYNTDLLENELIPAMLKIIKEASINQRLYAPDHLFQVLRKQKLINDKIWYQYVEDRMLENIKLRSPIPQSLKEIHFNIESDRSKILDNIYLATPFKITGSTFLPPFKIKT